MAQTFTWNVAAGTWDNSADWVGGIPNDGTVEALIANGGTATVGGGTSFLVGTLIVGTGTVGDTSAVSIADNAALTVATSIINHATISLNSAGNTTDLRIAGGATVSLSGGGTVLLAGTSNANYIPDAALGTGELINVDNTIAGQGNIGLGQLALDNRSGGVIDANSAAALTLQSNGAGFANEGLIEATGGGGMGINGGTIAQSATGTLLATGTGSSIRLYNNAAVTGGTLTTKGGGSIYTVSGHVVTLSGLTVSAGSTYTGNDNSYTTLAGTIVNQGTLALASAGNPAEFRVGGGQTVTLQGTGTVNLGGTSTANYIRDAALGTGELINTGNVIQGMGHVGNGQMAMDNQAGGIVDANLTGQGLDLQPNSAGFTNEGLLEATNGGILGINGASGGAIAQTGGTILATGAGSGAELYYNATVSGGTLTTSNGGSIFTLNGHAATLTNVTLSAGSTYTGNDNSTTYVT